MSNERILIVEDEPITAMNEQQIIESLGYSVTAIANTGEQAIASANEDRPDLVMMDINLGAGMDGIETATEIRLRYRIPVIFVTAHGDQKILDRAKKSEPFGYVLKPFSKEEIAVSIEIAVHKHRIEIQLYESEEKLRMKVAELVDANERIEEQAANLADLADHLSIARDEAVASSHAKSTFLANMSHELRTPLNAILGFSEMMNIEAMGPLDNTHYQGYVKDIHGAGKHLLDVINDLLDISKIESGSQELEEKQLDLRVEIDNAIKLVKGRAENQGVKVSASIPTALPKLLADELRLKQILLNLLTNAIKFTPEQGQVSIDAMLSDEQAIMIKVIDTGIGIAADDIPKVFEPFSQIESILQCDQEGTGLGVPLTKSLAKLHGGNLEIESEIGKGTTVIVSFPAERTCYVTS